MVKLNEFISKQGRRIGVRQIRADEPHLLLDLFAHMSSESRYQRFLQTVDHLSTQRLWDEATHIAQQSEAGDVCLGGFVVDKGGQETLIGAARYVHVDDDSVEIALSIRDDYQNQGIGTGLLALLIAEARARGVRQVVATVQNDNERMLHLLHRLDMPVTRTVDGASSFFAIDLK